MITLGEEEHSKIYIGCAGWSIPKEHAHHFADGNSHLERYATRFNAVEINTSFYRPHRPATYVRWAESVPDGFQFSVKIPREITHTRRLKDSSEPLAQFLTEATSLGGKLGPLLIQLPPSLQFEPDVVEAFLAKLREQFDGSVVCEPRHPTWFTTDAEDLFKAFEIARVAADPVVMPQPIQPGGWPGLVYYRLHGSPVIYRSTYSKEFLARLNRAMRPAIERGVPVWCIFDNTAEGAGTLNALELRELME